jgi:hypothetical protein
VLYGLLLLMIFYPGELAQAYHQIRGWIENRGQPPRSPAASSTPSGEA